MRERTAFQFAGIILALVISGCASIGQWWADNGDDLFAALEQAAAEWQASQTNAPPETPDAPATNVVSGELSGNAGQLPAGFPSEIDGPVKWLNPSVAAWQVTAKLQAGVGGGKIRVDYDKAKVWPVRDNVVGNPWAIVKINGQWYAATWEYLKPGQVEKPMCVLAKCDGKGDHFKVSPLSSWTPHSGERIGLMVSGLNRGNLKNVQERSNVEMVTWP